MPDVRISFRVISADLDPAEVTRLLGLNPSTSHRRGEPHLGPRGQRYSDFPTGVWSYDVPCEAIDLEGCLVFLLETLEPRKSAVRDLQVRGYRMDFFVGLFGSGDGNLGFGIGPQTLERIGTLGARLEFDIYP